MNKIFIEVDGILYENLLDIRVRRDMTEFCGTFSLSTTNENAKISDLGDFPIKSNSQIKIYIDKFPVMNGYVDSISINSTADEYTLSISGRDITQDILDSSLVGNTEFRNRISFKKVIERVLSNLGVSSIQVIDNVGSLDDFKTSELISGSIDETCFEFLNKLAKKRQVLLATNGEGNITISRSSNETIDGELRSIIGDNQNNVLSATSNIDNTSRFNKYNIYSQDNISSGFDDYDDPPNKTATQSDAEIRGSRQINIIPENSSNTKDCRNRAIWESNYRKARSNTIGCSVKGFYANEQNEILWQTNKLVNTRIDVLGVYTDLLIKSVEFSQRENEIVTNLELVNKNSYTLGLNLEKLNILQSEQKDKLF
jgi:prophage tail gpP-like protein